jgi:hypothetical protein
MIICPVWSVIVRFCRVVFDRGEEGWDCVA